MGTKTTKSSGLGAEVNGVEDGGWSGGCYKQFFCEFTIQSGGGGALGCQGGTCVKITFVRPRPECSGNCKQ